ncbi:MAG: hypothetical protein Q4G43_04850 [Mobilicoccus sp.]|nr:hypothetical protein [Mobilicoccus sp.]
MTVLPLDPSAPLAGAEGAARVTDVEVLDEHQLRRRRLDVALRRGSSMPSAPEPTWRVFVAALIILLIALGGAVVGGTVSRHLASRPATTAPETPVVFEPGQPYGQVQNAPQTKR